MFFITSIKARIIKGAIAEGLHVARSMLGDSNGKVPKDMKVRLLFYKMTEKAKSLEQSERAVSKNIYFFRDIFCWLADEDPCYTKILSELLRDIVTEENAFILTLPTGDEATVNRLIARRAQLKASGALGKEAKPYKSDPTSLLIGM